MFLGESQFVSIHGKGKGRGKRKRKRRVLVNPNLDHGIWVFFNFFMNLEI